MEVCGSQKVTSTGSHLNLLERKGVEKVDDLNSSSECSRLQPNDTLIPVTYNDN
jgi:hypothetical protein